MRNRLLILLGAAVIIAVGVSAVAASGGDDDDGDSAATASTENASVELWIMDNGPRFTRPGYRSPRRPKPANRSSWASTPSACTSSRPATAGRRASGGPASS
jgi:hypothetical protein